MRFRQFVFVAEDLETAVIDIGATLGLAVCYNDPNVAEFGLHNALLPIGGDLIEVVATLASTVQEEDHRPFLVLVGIIPFRQVELVADGDLSGDFSFKFLRGLGRVQGAGHQHGSEAKRNVFH